MFRTGEFKILLTAFSIYILYIYFMIFVQRNFLNMLLQCSVYATFELSAINIEQLGEKRYFGYCKPYWNVRKQIIIDR